MSEGLRPSNIMTLTNDRERILAMGGPSFGKSYNFYSIAALAAETGSDAKFYIVDTDESVGRMLSDPNFRSLWNEDMSALVNIEFEQVYDWDDLIEAIEKFQKKMRKIDWLLIDMVSPTWAWVQDWFTNTIFHKDLSAYFTQKRVEMGEVNKGKMKNFDGWRDWPTIKAEYGKLQNYMLRCPGHLYATSEVKALDAESADKETKATFGPYGVVPVGQARTPHLFSTILWCQKPRPREYEIVTIKDRSRRELTGEKITSFGNDYLLKVAGWQVKTPEEVAAENKAKLEAIAKIKARAAAKQEELESVGS